MPEDKPKQLSLYHRDFCYFCASVRKTIQQLNMDVKSKNIWEDDAAFSELHRATGRTTVPVLRIESAQGEISWMSESSDIIHYLKSL